MLSSKTLKRPASACTGEGRQRGFQKNRRHAKLLVPIEVLHREKTDKERDCNPGRNTWGRHCRTHHAIFGWGDNIRGDSQQEIHSGGGGPYMQWCPVWWVRIYCQHGSRTGHSRREPVRDTYLKTYSAVDKIDQTLLNYDINYRCWKWWHAPMRHATAIAMSMAYNIYVQYSEGGVDPNWQVKPVSSAQFKQK